MNILAATTNPGKIREITEILAGLEVAILTPKETNVVLDVEEDGSSFAENAAIKARAWCAASGLPALADDSGLCVDALGGRPGVRSARFAGQGASDEDNYLLLLESMSGEKDRRARFVCAVALAFPGGDIVFAEGSYEGRILEEPVGEGGFGYDPVFFDPASGKSFAQLTPQEKNERSHRKKALVELKRKLLQSGYLTQA
ncbi:MAG TPA: RdgB/HAM1 family non-canonical purine NTP pyrophosphatase [Deltaproteobacteria bacterium]|nr:RdgB/HAM1 family non-canonical purine NTP pyrophosphatase [Deltaproteobacteria bacterium]